MPEYISREAALSEACKGCSIDFPCEPCEPQDCEIKARLQEIPAADVVEVRHGQWNGVATGWECSVCTIVSNNTYPHCPYCGAVMYGGQEDE